MLKHTYTQLGVIARPRPHHPMAEAAVPGVGGDCNEQPREAPAARRDDVRVWRASVPVLEAPRTAVAVAVALVARIVDELGQRVVVAPSLELSSFTSLWEAAADDAPCSAHPQAWLL